MENYKLTKAIRFKLESNDNNNLIQQKVKEVRNISFELPSFVTQLGDFKSNLKQYLFFKGKSGDEVLKNALSIKSSWLKLYAKQLFHDSEAVRDKTKRKQTKTIADFPGLAWEIEDRFEEFEATYQALTNDAAAELNERARNAQTGLLLKKLSNKNGLSYFVDLVENTVDKKEEDNLSVQLKQQGRALQQELLAGIQKYLPEQSAGLPIAKASFNYYTINKKPVDYAQKIKEQKDKLKINDWERQVFERTNFSKAIKENIQLNITDLDALRQKLKNIKAQQKAQFNELITQDISYQNLKDNIELYLFNTITEQEFNSYKQQTEKIEKKATQLNQSNNEDEKRRLRSDLQRLKKERGSLINAADKKNQNSFKTYKDFANLYRNIALKQGRIISTIKGIEKEEVESLLLNYWATVFEHNKQHQLVLLPKDDAQKAYGLISNYQKGISTASTKLYWFESFTLRSLRKLCFGHLEAGTNTFNENIQSVLRKHSYSEIDNRGYNKQVRIEGEFSFKGDTQKIINFYKDVLTSDYAQRVLKLPQQQIQSEIISQNFDSLDEFQIALEKICYKRYTVIDNTILERLISDNNAQVFSIHSYDLQKVEQGNFKTHTHIWKDFWSNENTTNNFDIRLNPEITILWRDAKSSRVSKYGKGSQLYDEQKKNRYLHPQFTLVTTISEHSNTPTKELTFMTDDEFTRSVEEFNSKFKKEDFKFALGLDNGETELATLGVYLPVFQQNSHQDSIQEINKINKYGFKVLSITDLAHTEADKNGKDRKIIQNPSYFLSKEQYTRTFDKTEAEYQAMFSKLFKEETLLTLDLTTAKVIGGYIITNGDVPTYFNLWIRHAQRLIWEMNDHADKKTAKKIVIKNNAELTENEKAKFIYYLNEYPSISFEEYNLLSKNKKANYTDFHGLNSNERVKYTEWIFNFWDGKDTTSLSEEEKEKFEKVRTGKLIKKGQRVGYYSEFILFAVCYIGENLETVTDIFDVRNVFKLRKDFYAIKNEQEINQELNHYNIAESRQQISNEELDLKINHLKTAVVANAIGVIDFLYHYYKEKTQGEGLVVKEGFDTNSVAEGLGKFSGNIYRILERKLYQKFQNYGLVPPIKNLMAVRSEGLKNDKGAILRLGNIGFIDPEETSQNCPICATKFGHHQDVFKCSNCGFSPEKIMHSNDGIAGYNIAKRGFENFSKPSLPTTNSNSSKNNLNKGNNPSNNRNESIPLTTLGAALAAAEAKKKR